MCECQGSKMGMPRQESGIVRLGNGGVRGLEGGSAVARSCER
jgi:hypothetical protein